MSEIKKLLTILSFYQKLTESVTVILIIDFFFKLGPGHH